LRDFDQFWSGEPRQRRSSASRKRKHNGRVSKHRLAKYGVEKPSQKEVQQFCRISDEVEGRLEPVMISRQEAYTLACLSTYARQTLPDHRPIACGLKILIREAGVSDLNCLPTRLIGSLVLAHLALLHGIPLGYGREIGLTEEADQLGWIDIDRGVFHLKIANGYDPKLQGRIAPQGVLLPVTAATEDLVRGLVRRGVKAIKQLYGQTPLDETYDDLQDFIQEQDACRKYLGRLEQAWLYVALRKVRMNPGIVPLLCGRIYGPFRAESSYLSLPSSLLADQVSKIHREIFGLANLPARQCQELTESGRVGKDHSSLDKWVNLAATTLEGAVEHNQLCATVYWIPALHARRWTKDMPSPKAVFLDDDQAPMLLLADKDLGGGRRVRPVPVSEIGVHALRSLK
jgi:hypothetical protein